MEYSYKCKLCGQLFSEKEISEEHYPARSVGNNDIVKMNLVEVVDYMMSEEAKADVLEEIRKGTPISELTDPMFDSRFSSPMYPKGRTAKTLCRECNTHLGKYDEAYYKFFIQDGDCNKIRSFQQKTKLRVIKSIFGKFLSVPEAENEEFDFIEFLRDDSIMEYKGIWSLFLVRRDMGTDILGFKDLSTGVVEYDEGVVYELSDEKFIFNLMNFPKHSEYNMTSIFEILNKKYQIVDGVDHNGGYHSQLVMQRAFDGWEDPPIE